MIGHGAFCGHTWSGQNEHRANMALNLAPFGRWTLRDRVGSAG